MFNTYFVDKKSPHTTGPGLLRFAWQWIRDRRAGRTLLDLWPSPAHAEEFHTSVPFQCTSPWWGRKQCLRLQTRRLRLRVLNLTKKYKWTKGLASDLSLSLSLKLLPGPQMASRAVQAASLGLRVSLGISFQHEEAQELGGPAFCWHTRQDPTSSWAVLPWFSRPPRRRPGGAQEKSPEQTIFFF